MVIFLFILIRILLIALLAIFIWNLVKTNSFKNTLRLIGQGFKRGLQGSGMAFPDKSKNIELYQWIPDKKIEVCEASATYAKLDPMDLASWMEQGLPKSVDSYSSCQKDCQCQLVCIKKQSLKS